MIVYQHLDYLRVKLLGLRGSPPIPF